ncbi:MAG: oxygen-dependent coproporphyrinogen oxidase [Luteibaculum sp.]
MPDRESISKRFLSIQDQICRELEKADGQSSFITDDWQRPGGGGGKSRVLKNGAVIEKGGVNFSSVYGELPDAIAKEFGVGSKEFFATGVSIVIHPKNPHVPIVHMNIRYFEMEGDNWWFGGGIDLTPHYVNKKEAKSFHSVLKAVCDKHHSTFYPEFKEWADRYFFIPHRDETRGVGGIFFDRLNGHKMDLNKEEWAAFVYDVGESFLPAYLPILEANKNKPFTEDQKQWQLLRRGRYVEFNLVYDRGTHFGLKTNGRIESILMSLPKYASWEYDFKVQEKSPEAETLGLLKKGISWVD